MEPNRSVPLCKWSVLEEGPAWLSSGSAQLKKCGGGGGKRTTKSSPNMQI